GGGLAERVALTEPGESVRGAVAEPRTPGAATRKRGERRPYDRPKKIEPRLSIFALGDDEQALEHGDVSPDAVIALGGIAGIARAPHDRGKPGSCQRSGIVDSA